MRKHALLLMMLLILAICSGCWYVETDRIDTTASKDLKSDLISYNISIKKVDIISYTQSYRPQYLDIDVYISDSPTENSVNMILDRVKKFVTYENVGDLDVLLNIFTSGKSNEAAIIYSSHYDNTVIQTDNSPDNISGYTWYNEK